MYKCENCGHKIENKNDIITIVNTSTHARGYWETSDRRIYRGERIVKNKNRIDELFKGCPNCLDEICI